MIMEAIAACSRCLIGNARPVNNERDTVGNLIGRLMVAPDVEFAMIFTMIGSDDNCRFCLLYTSPSPRDGLLSRMPSSA